MSPTRIDARVGLLLADDHAEQRGLARAVRSDHADDAAGRQLEVEPIDQHAAVEALLEVLRLQHDAAEPRARRDLNLRRAQPCRVRPPRPACHRPGCAPCSWPAAPSGSTGSTRARAARCAAWPRPRGFPARRAWPSARASLSNCPCRGRPARDRAPASTA